MKKRPLFKILALVLSFALLLVPISAGAEQTNLNYDINGDGKVRLTDVTTLARIVAGWSNIGYFDPNKTDVNEDGKLNIKDVVLLAQLTAEWKNTADQSKNLEKYNWPDIDVTSPKTGTAFNNISEAPSYSGALSQILILKEKNAGLSFNTALYISGNTATALLPAGTAINNLKLNFTHSADSITCNGQEVISGVTPLDFTRPVTLSLSSGSATTEITVYIMTLNTGLPSMSITLDNFTDIESKTEYSECNVFAGGGNYEENGDYAFDKNTVLNASGKIKCRGWTSYYYYPKKSYTLKFSKKQSLLGLPENKEWVLAANYADRSLIRNAVATQLAYAVGMEYIMDVRFVDLWVNGEYVGNYQLIEKIEVHENRVDITDFDENLAPEDIGYIVETNGHNKASEFEKYTNGKDTDRPNDWQKLSPDFTYDPVSGDIFYDSNYYDIIYNVNKPSDSKLMELSADKRNKYLYYIYDYVNKFEEAIFCYDYEDACNYMDMESLAKWYIVNELTMNVDSNLHSSCYMYKDAGGKLKMGPLWDFDLGFGNGHAITDARIDGTYLDNQKWFKDLFYMPEFKAEVKKVWNASKDEISNILAFTDQMAALVNNSQKSNYKIWSITGYAQWSNNKLSTSMPNYNDQISYIKNFTRTRINYMDNKISNW